MFLIDVLVGGAVEKVLLVELVGKASFGMADGRRGRSLSLGRQVAFGVGRCLLGDGSGRYMSVMVVGVFLEVLSLLLEHDPSILLADLDSELVAVLMEFLRGVWDGGIVLH